MIRFIEELTMNAWPSIETILYDGWIIRYSNGYTKRSNSVNPIYPSTIDINEKILRCENLFKFRNLPSIFKITPGIYPDNLDKLLDNNGYVAIENTSVRLLALDKISKPDYDNITVCETLNETWLLNFCLLSHIEYTKMQTIRNMLETIRPRRFFVSLKLNEEVIACGLAVLENKHLGLFDVVVDSNLRGQGYGEQLMLNLLNIGKANDATHSYLQVVDRNIIASRLYQKLGYKELYKYWYRVKLT